MIVDRRDPIVESDDDDDESNDQDEMVVSHGGEMTGCQIMILGTNLHSFNYVGNLRTDFFLCNSSPLVYASLFMYSTSRGASYRAHKLLRKLTSMKLLIIHPTTFEACMAITLSAYDEEQDNWTLEPVPPSFSTHLKTIDIWRFIGSDDELHVVKVLLRTATVLEKMRFKFFALFINQIELYEEIKKFPKASPNCEIGLL
ncbi:F-box/LRR-repeat protein [Corchorus capsularis]|uniref:F-box/LRR-repeat protein n=1 Tax=Corchorus capsularis TaxID=210143 RepID=A0A1R3I9G6_COCAP|nr:F-box/LRR-repeat protein [Corchorus capsularis]